jgi:hypothetical protein
MHVFANLIKYLKAGEIAVEKDGELIKINFEIFELLGGDEFPDLDFFKMQGCVQRPTQMKTLSQNIPGITFDEILAAQDFVQIFEDMYQLYIFNKKDFKYKHKDKMLEYQKYTDKLPFLWRN